MTGAFHFGRHRVIGLIGIVIAAILFWLVSSRIALNKISTLRITWPGGKPTDPPLLDIPLPTVIAVGVIAALLVAGALYLIVWQRSNTVPYYMGALIFATILIILIWASAGNRVDMVICWHAWCGWPPRSPLVRWQAFCANAQEWSISRSKG